MSFETCLHDEIKEGLTGVEKESNHRILPVEKKLGIRRKELSMPDPWLRMKEWRLMDLNFENSIDADEIRQQTRPIFQRRKSSYSEPSSSSLSSSSSSESDEEFAQERQSNIKVRNDPETALGKKTFQINPTKS